MNTVMVISCLMSEPMSESSFLFVWILDIAFGIILIQSPDITRPEYYG